jgi:uncharacterized cupin superfamily protein
MQKINLKEIPEEEYRSPKGKFHQFYKGVSLALGCKPDAPEANKRAPFDLELVRLPPGASLCPYHIESAQWEMYLVVSGRGTIRHSGGTTEVVAGDSFIFAPGEAHQQSNFSDEDFIYYVIADNPIGDCAFYPDSNKWGVRIGSKFTVLQQEIATYLDGEE